MKRLVEICVLAFRLEGQSLLQTNGDQVSLTHTHHTHLPTHSLIFKKRGEAKRSKVTAGFEPVL